MKTLIIGHKGMLGQALIKILEEKGWEYKGYDRDEIDITDAPQVLARICNYNPELLINTAAYNAVDKAEDEPEIAMLVNGTAVGYLAQAAKKCGAIFVHYSTDFVFDGKNEVGYDENSKPNPLSVYGRSKLKGEEETMAASLLVWYIIRTSRLFGPPGISTGSKKSFPKLMIDLAKEKEELKAIDAEVSSPTYVKDLAEKTLAIVEARLDSGIYHATNSGGCTWYGYAKTAFAAAGLKTRIIPVASDHFPRKAERPAHSILISTKTPPMRPWHQALDEFLRL